MADLPKKHLEDVLEVTRSKVGYPAYQHYMDNLNATYCTKTKVKSHAVGAAWVKSCLAGHPGTSCNGKPWLSNSQDGTIW